MCMYVSVFVYESVSRLMTALVYGVWCTPLEQGHYVLIAPLLGIVEGRITVLRVVEANSVCVSVRRDAWSTRESKWCWEWWWCWWCWSSEGSHQVLGVDVSPFLQEEVHYVHITAETGPKQGRESVLQRRVRSEG
jgi:hypothetical protein